jgi:hypothetical protein
MHNCPTSLLSSNVVLVAGAILAIWSLVETGLPLVSHPFHHWLPQRLMIGVPLLVADGVAGYLMVRGWFLAGIGVGVAAGLVGVFFAGKLEESLIAEVKQTDVERLAAVKRAGRVSRLARPFLIAALSALLLVGALPR